MLTCPAGAQSNPGRGGRLISSGLPNQITPQGSSQKGQGYWQVKTAGPDMTAERYSLGQHRGLLLSPLKPQPPLSLLHTPSSLCRPAACQVCV